MTNGLAQKSRKINLKIGGPINGDKETVTGHCLPFGSIWDKTAEVEWPLYINFHYFNGSLNVNCKNRLHVDDNFSLTMYVLFRKSPIALKDNFDIYGAQSSERATKKCRSPSLNRLWEDARNGSHFLSSCTWEYIICAIDDWCKTPDLLNALLVYISVRIGYIDTKIKARFWSGTE